MLPSIGPFFARTAFVEVCGEKSLVPAPVLSRGQVLPADDGFWPLSDVTCAAHHVLPLGGNPTSASPRRYFCC